MSIELVSPAFADGERIPRKYTGEGEDVSPPLRWTGLPEGTRQLALICDDPDAPTPRPWVHWVLWGLDPKLEGLAEGDNGGGVEGVTDFGRPGYGGPMPPAGHGPHRYFFRLYALDAPVDLKPGATKYDLLDAMKGHILDEGVLTGTYER